MVKVSIALATYNGEKYILEQLESIVWQTRLPEEIVICDDGSSDKTLKVINDFKKKTKIKIKVLQNKRRLGAVKNFEKAISLCQGDIIFFCDQDDVWLPDKIEIYLDKFQSLPNIEMISSDAEVCDVSLHPLGYSLWDTVEYNQAGEQVFNQSKYLNKLLRRNIVCGATLAIRKSIINVVLPVGKGWMHDGWIGLIGASRGSLLTISQKTIRYRQHKGQAIGAIKISFRRYIELSVLVKKEDYLLVVEKLNVLKKRLEKRCGGSAMIWTDAVEGAIAHNVFRVQMPIIISQRINVILKELANRNYFRYGGGLISAVKDMFVNK